MTRMKTRARGFTAIKVLIVIMIIDIFLSMILKSKEHVTSVAPEKSPSQCISGYAHTKDNKGSLRQVVNEQGGGAPC